MRLAYVCMYVCMCACVRSCVYVCMCVCMYVSIHARMHARMYVCMNACRYVYACVCARLHRGNILSSLSVFYHCCIYLVHVTHIVKIVCSWTCIWILINLDPLALDGCRKKWHRIKCHPEKRHTSRKHVSLFS